MYGGLKLSLVDDVDRAWSVKLKIGDREYSYKLYDTFDKGLVFKGKMIDGLKRLISEYNNYVAGDIITSIFSPEGEDFLNYAMFLLIIELNEKAYGYEGDHCLLFALRKDGNIHLTGVNNSDLTQDEVVDILAFAFEEPDAVKTLIMAFAPIQER